MIVILPVYIVTICVINNEHNVCILAPTCSASSFKSPLDTLLRRYVMLLLVAKPLEHT